MTKTRRNQSGRLHARNSGDEDLKAEAEHLVASARSKKLTLLTAESCAARALAALSPRSRTRERSSMVALSFSKENKFFTVGVPVEVISKHTAVSAQVAKAMAVGGVERSPADIAMGYGCCRADPDEDRNPVGLVFISAATREGCVLEERLTLSGNKAAICNAAMKAALRLAERL